MKLKELIKEGEGLDPKYYNMIASAIIDLFTDKGGKYIDHAMNMADVKHEFDWSGSGGFRYISRPKKNVIIFSISPKNLKKRTIDVQLTIS